MASAAAPDQGPLGVGDVRHATLDGGAQATFTIALSAGDFVRAVVVQAGIDLVARLRAPDGTAVVEMDSPNGTTGPESIAAVVDTAGTYQLEVASLDPRAATGDYHVRLEAVRPADERDRAWARAEAAEARAAVLAWSGRRPSLEAAVTRYGDALDAWRAAGRANDEAEAGLALGHVLRRLGRYDEARQRFVTGRDQLAALADEAGRARADNALCLVEQAAGRLDQAVAHCQTAIDTFRRLDEPVRAGRALNNLGLIHHRAGRFDEALTAYERAVPLLRDGGDDHTHAVTLGNAGAVHDARGDYATARQHYELALPILRATGDRRRVADTLNNLGLALRHQGELQDAIDRFADAGTAYATLGDTRRMAASRINRASLDAWLGRPAGCIAQLAPLLDDPESALAPETEARLRYALAACQAQHGEHDEAIAGFRMAIEMRQETGDRAGLAAAWRALGQAQAATGDLAAARTSLDRASREATTIGRRPLERLIAQDLAEIHLRHDDHVQARTQAARALRLAEDLGDPRGRFEALRIAARSAWAAGEIDRTIAHAEAGVGAIESLRAELISPRRRATFFATIRDLYDLAVAAHLAAHARDEAAGHAAAAYVLAERARARTLLEQVERPVRASRAPAPLVARRDRLRRSLEGLAGATTAGGRDGDATEAVEREIRDVLDQLEQLDTQIARSDPELAAVVAPAPATLTDVQRTLLATRDLLLSYLVGEDQSHVFAITHDAVTVHTLPGRDALDDLTAAVAHQWRAVDRTAGEDQRAAAATAAKTLLGPVASRMAEGQRLLVVADGGLAALPFAALPHPDGSGRLVLDVHTVAMLSSASVLRALRERRTRRPVSPARPTALIMADPVFDPHDPRLAGGAGTPATTRQLEAGTYPRLPASRREAAAIATVTERFGATRVALDFEATRARLLAPSVRDYRLIHLATHAVLDDERPSLSGVVLSRVGDDGQPRDGFLRLHEIYDLDLDADLLVLSACNTAAGTLVHGEGLVGLTHGFLSAGAHAVIATLWPIDDRAGAALMEHFYGALLDQRVSPAEALAHAQRALRQRARWRHPYYWAGYVARGDALAVIATAAD